MKGIFVNENGGIHYAQAIVSGYKDIETRKKNMLKNLVGQRVAVVCTHRGKNPVVLGYVDIVESSFCKAEDFDKYFNRHGVPNNCGYYCNGTGKWFYYLANAEKCEAYPLPANAVRHGRSWCEF